MTVSEAVFLSLLISACGLQEDEKELNPKALPFYFARNSNESSLAKFLKGWTELRNAVLSFKLITSAPKNISLKLEVDDFRDIFTGRSISGEPRLG